MGFLKKPMAVITWLPLGYSSARAKRNGMKSMERSTQMLHSPHRLSLEVGIVLVDSCFYVVCFFSAHSGPLKWLEWWAWSTPLGSSAFPRCLFAMELPKKTHPQNSSRLLGRCSHLDRPPRCIWKLFQSCPKQPV